ncbi:hypothetical protein [Streptomyces noursei]|uniref:hypothetical protein n=1 Tax=Streptomyces noursei TaxID=1971 RepID=UPI0016780DA8|nr:hypothetical protein [Streptomyces noursei]MCZ1014465.1 hypothetical protein [Streptomyces noursei]GGW95250.1 hypothetical protein GCM10010341_15540 [Streptomyces noursei]
MDIQRPPAVVHPLSEGTRRVTVRGEPVGRARNLADVYEFLRRAGLEDPVLADSALIEWRGGDREVWAQ